LEYHLVSRLTSLVAVDLTPTRPLYDGLVRKSVPTQLPEGWDFGSLAFSETLSIQPKPVGAAPNSSSHSQRSISLPNTASPHVFMIWLGFIMMLIGFLHTKRTALSLEVRVSFKSKALSLAFLLGGVCLFGQGAYMGAKAGVAQVLLENAWDVTLETKTPSQLWGSMDARPIARLTAPKQGESAIVLDTMSGQALAFAPAHDTKSVLPGHVGLSLIAAHKNTHFAFLEHLSIGDEIHLTSYKGEAHIFRVSDIKIVDKEASGITMGDVTEASRSRLALVTCYPFNRLSFGGRRRYIVFADKVNTMNVVDMPPVSTAAI